MTVLAYVGVTVLHSQKCARRHADRLHAY